MYRDIYIDRYIYIYIYIYIYMYIHTSETHRKPMSSDQDADEEHRLEGQHCARGFNSMCKHPHTSMYSQW